MLVSYFYACLWAFFILLACVGWGWLVSTVSSKNNYRLGMLGVFGISFSMIIGGFFNLYKLISPFSVIIYLCIGSLFFLLFLWRRRNNIIDQVKQGIRILQLDKVFTSLVLYATFFLIIRISFYDFHPIDDNGGYLAFPFKMIQTGELGGDPFSERRIVSSLGGQYFLDTFVLAVLDYKYIHIIDNVVSFVFYLLLLYELLSSIKLNKYIKILFFVVSLFIASPTYNITSVVTSSVLFLGLLILIFQSKKDKKEMFIFVPIVVSALILSKSNIIVPTVFLASYYYLTAFKNSAFFLHSTKIKDVIHGAITNLVTPLLLIIGLVTPWMISMYHSSGTFLYPILGKGYHGISYGNFLSHYFSFDFYSFIRLFFELYTSLSLLIPLVILVIVVLFFKIRQKELLLFFLSSAILGVIALIYATGGYSLYYYIFSFVLPVVMCCLIMINKDVDSGDQMKISIVTIVILFFMLGFYINKGLDVFKDIKSGISFENGLTFGFFNSNPVSSLEIEKYHNLQATIPRNEIILARLDKNFLLNFTRNKVYIADAPGAASLPTGMPMFKGENALSEYLLSKNIKYIACSCGEGGTYSKESVSGMLKVHVNPWLKTEAMNLIDFQENFIKLAKHKKVLYDDGINIVIDLSLEK